MITEEVLAGHLWTRLNCLLATELPAHSGPASFSRDVFSSSSPLTTLNNSVWMKKNGTPYGVPQRCLARFSKCRKRLVKLLPDYLSPKEGTKGHNIFYEAAQEEMQLLWKDGLEEDQRDSTILEGDRSVAPCRKLSQREADGS